MLLLFVVGQALPRGLALPTGIVIIVAALAGSVGWQRRHPAIRQGDLAARHAASPVQADAAAISTTEWVRGLVVVGAVCALVVAAVGLLFAFVPR
jgi:hypothetical protein